MNKDKKFKKSYNKSTKEYRFKMFDPIDNKWSVITYDKDQAIRVKDNHFKTERNYNYKLIYYKFNPKPYNPYFLWRLFWFLKYSIGVMSGAILRIIRVIIIAITKPLKKVKTGEWYMIIVAIIGIIVMIILNN